MSRPTNVGIKAFEIYVPGKAVNQTELEKFDGIPAGKYTIGLGQTNMSFVDDREDIYSFALTAVSRLLKKNNIDVNSIGRLEVGTETLLDKSKSVKTVLMQLFGENSDIEGVDTINACYGGTSALFSAINWVESSSWDGRNAIVVSGDIAIYAKGNARPTGGAGAVALLIGPDAPLVFDPVHGTHMEHAYDFYKPDFTSEYPYVNGHFSLTCYIKAFDACYKAYQKKAEKKGVDFGGKKGADMFDYCVFHTPNCKQSVKSFARMYYNDYVAGISTIPEADVPAEIKSFDYQQSLTEKSIEKTFIGLTKKQAAAKLSAGLIGPTNTGNMYSASVFSALASLLAHTELDELKGKRISMYSYGSGLASSLYSLVVKGDISEIVKNLDFKNQLADRTIVTPEQYEADLGLREKAHLAKQFKPTGSLDTIKPGVYYLTEVNDQYERFYAVK